MTDQSAHFRDAEPKDADAICLLNRMDVSRLSPMDIDRFGELLDASCFCQVAELNNTIVAFLIGFQDGADYDSINYRWFDTHMKQFFYIDRVVVDARYRGRGIASAFYRKIQAFARDHDLNWLAAEIDIEPPNTTSLAFHNRFGFNEVGTQVHGEGKMVSLQLGPVPPA